jgi:hypothetical protein
MNGPGLVQARWDELARRGIGQEPMKLPEGGRGEMRTLPGARSDPSPWAAFGLSGNGR